MEPSEIRTHGSRENYAFYAMTDEEVDTSRET
jgi:hypothetical protein